MPHFTEIDQPPTNEGWYWMLITSEKYSEWLPVKISVSNGFFYAWVFFGITILLLVINCFIPTKDDLISMMNELSDDDGR